jgi:hypothetical protein
MRQERFLIRFRKDGLLDYRVLGTPIKVRGVIPSLFASTVLRTKFVSNERILELQEELKKRGRARFTIERYGIYKFSIGPA